MAERLRLGVIVGAHGVKGAVRIKSFTEDPADLTRYGRLEDEQGRSFKLIPLAVGAKGVVTAKLDGVADRNQAEAMKGTALYVSRDALPKPEEDEFYVTDMIGLTAFGLDGKELGKVKAVFDFGAGDLVEVKGEDGDLLVPFTKAAVPEVDIAGGKIVIDPPVLTEWDKDLGQSTEADRRGGAEVSEGDKEG